MKLVYLTYIILVSVYALIISLVIFPLNLISNVLKAVNNILRFPVKKASPSIQKCMEIFLSDKSIKQTNIELNEALKRRIGNAQIIKK